MAEKVFVQFHSRWFYIPAIISIAFMFAYIGIKDCYKQIKSYVAMLDDDQKKVYNDIRKERESAYWCAMMQGCFIAILYIMFATLTCGKSKSVYHLISDILCIILTTTYFVYILKPKKKIMLLDGDMDEQQEKKWVGIYRCMQKSFWSYFLIGLLTSGFLFTILDIIMPPMTVCMIPNKKKYSSSSQQQKKKK